MPYDLGTVLVMDAAILDKMVGESGCKDKNAERIMGEMVPYSGIGGSYGNMDKPIKKKTAKTFNLRYEK